MPIYEYQCEKCGIRFDRLQTMSSDPVSDCPECGGQVHRVISPVGVIFKGSGFYVTDNRKANAGTARGAQKKEDDATAIASKAPAGETTKAAPEQTKTEKSVSSEKAPQKNKNK